MDELDEIELQVLLITDDEIEMRLDLLLLLRYLESNQGISPSRAGRVCQRPPYRIAWARGDSNPQEVTGFESAAYAVLLPARCAPPGTRTPNSLVKSQVL